MKPKYFIVKRDEHDPLWKEYIQWLNKTYNQNWAGGVWEYYGFDGRIRSNGTNAEDRVEFFSNDPTLLTLEQWDEIFRKPEINPFVVGDKVYHHVFDEGVVIEIGNDPHTPVVVDFPNIQGDDDYDFHFHPKELSFSPYEVQVNHERPIDYDKLVGAWCWFWDDGDNERLLDVFKEFDGKRFEGKNISRYDNMKPISEQMKKQLIDEGII